MNIKEIIQSKPYMIVALAISVIAVICLIFGGGMYIGYRKARFSYQWGENYHKNFGGPRGGFMGDFGGKDLINANGVAGQIMKIDNSTLVIRGRDNVEKIVAVKDDTVINRLNETVKLNALKIGDFVVVIGEPNDDGQIDAKFLRTIPAPASSTAPMMLPMFRGQKELR
ncbi:MAG: hypothetical protein ABIG73_02310 [Patescibacteria group bacterium]